MSSHDSFLMARAKAFAAGAIQFSLLSTRGDGRHWSLQIRHPDLGQPDVAASVEFARRPLVLEPERLDFLELPIHRTYNIDLPSLPVIAEAEACAEKLARYRRVPLGRDVEPQRLGSMNDFAHLAGFHRDAGQAEDLVALSASMAETPCSPLYPSHTSPDREVLALVADLTFPVSAGWSGRTAWVCTCSSLSVKV